MKGRGTTCVFPRRQQQCGRRRRTGTGMPSPPFGPAIIAISAGPGQDVQPTGARSGPLHQVHSDAVPIAIRVEKALTDHAVHEALAGAGREPGLQGNQARFACSTSHAYGQSSDLMIARPRATWSVDIITVNPQAGSRSHNVGWTQSTQRLGGRRGHPRNHLCGRSQAQHARFPRNRINRGRVRRACREAARDFWRVRSAGQSLAPDGVRLARLTKIRTRVQSITIKTME